MKLADHRACRGKHLTLLVRFPNQGRQVEDIELWSHTNETIGQLRRQLIARLATCVYVCMYTHTHPSNGPFSGTTQVSRYKKGKTSLDFTEARDSEWHWHQLGHMHVCTSL